MNPDRSRIPGFGFDPGFEPKPAIIQPPPPSGSIFGLISKVNQGNIQDSAKAQLTRPDETSGNVNLQQAKAVAQKLSSISPQAARENVKQKAFMDAKSNIERIQMGTWRAQMNPHQQYQPPPHQQQPQGFPPRLPTTRMQGPIGQPFKVPQQLPQVRQPPPQLVPPMFKQVTSLPSGIPEYIPTSIHSAKDQTEATKSLVAYDDDEDKDRRGRRDGFGRDQALEEIDRYRQQSRMANIQISLDGGREIGYGQTDDYAYGIREHLKDDGHNPEQLANNEYAQGRQIMGEEPCELRRDERYSQYRKFEESALYRDRREDEKQESDKTIKVGLSSEVFDYRHSSEAMSAAPEDSSRFARENHRRDGYHGVKGDTYYEERQRYDHTGETRDMGRHNEKSEHVERMGYNAPYVKDQDDTDRYGNSVNYGDRKYNTFGVDHERERFEGRDHGRMNRAGRRDERISGMEQGSYGEREIPDKSNMFKRDRYDECRSHEVDRYAGTEAFEEQNRRMHGIGDIRNRQGVVEDKGNVEDIRPDIVEDKRTEGDGMKHRYGQPGKDFNSRKEGERDRRSDQDPDRESRHAKDADPEQEFGYKRIFEENYGHQGNGRYERDYESRYPKIDADRRFNSDTEVDRGRSGDYQRTATENERSLDMDYWQSGDHRMEDGLRGEQDSRYRQDQGRDRRSSREEIHDFPDGDVRKDWKKGEHKDYRDIDNREGKDSKGIDLKKNDARDSKETNDSRDNEYKRNDSRDIPRERNDVIDVRERDDRRANEFKRNDSRNVRERNDSKYSDFKRNDFKDTWDKNGSRGNDYKRTDNRDTRGRTDSRDSAYNRNDTRELRERSDDREDGYKRNDNRNMRERNDNRVTRERNDNRDTRERNDDRDMREMNDNRDTRERNDNRDTRERNDNRDTRERNDRRDSGEGRNTVMDGDMPYEEYLFEQMESSTDDRRLSETIVEANDGYPSERKVLTGVREVAIPTVIAAGEC